VESSAAQYVPARSTPRERRIAEVILFLLIWGAIGLLLDASENQARLETYLLLGIPLGIGFQLFVRGESIRSAWVRGRPPVERPRLAIGLGIALAIYPLASLIEAIADGDPASLVLAQLVAIIGAGAAGYAFATFTRNTARNLVLCLLIVGAWSAVLYGLQGAENFLAHPRAFHPDQDLLILLGSFAYYLPICFVLEEVVFRGLIDSHVHHPGETHGVLTAILVSVLWTLWHVPMLGWDVLPGGLILMVPIGVALSIYWRRSGNLGVTATAHSFSDSLRNALVGVP
jgi:membrane protease YdiL (CAAX protease family)